MIASQLAGAGVRASAQYALLDGRWCESAHRFSGGYPAEQQITLFAPETGEPFTVSGAAIEAMADLTVTVRYRDMPWRLGGLWSHEERSPVTDVEAFRIRRPLDAGTKGVFASIAYLGENWRAAADLPGAQVLDPRDPANSDIVMRVPLADLQDFSEEIVMLKPRAGGGR